LKIKSFGAFEVLDSFDNPLIWRTQKTKELFAYLWEQKERQVSKALIMETIFPDKDLDKATTLLHTTIYQLRKNLGKLGYPNGILYFNDSYQLDLPITSDLEELNKILHSNVFGEEEIKKILIIYKGDFLEEEGYHWAMGIQQSYKDIVLNILEGFAKNQLKVGKIDSLLKISLDTIIRIDSFNESAAKMMIQYYGVQNKKSSLEQFYKEYVENLWKEMELQPMESTIQLYNRYMEKMK
jgi:two-component SAPR family response regulator